MALAPQCLKSQVPAITSPKWGTPTMEEMTMTTYEPDTSANAVMLCKTTELSYEFVGNQLKAFYDVKNKMKILKPQGIYDAVIEVVYNYNNNKQGNRESVRYVKGTTYNLVNGEIVASSVTNDLISHDDIDKHQRLMTLLFPNVEVGAVIEYEYRIDSDLYQEVKAWHAQDSIPVAYCSFNATFPEFFLLKIFQDKNSQLHHETRITNNYILQGPITAACKAQTHSFVGTNLPALTPSSPKVDEEIVMIDIKSVNLPGQKRISTHRTWNDIDQQLLDDEDFGSRMKENPLKGEMTNAGVFKINNKNEKIMAIVSLLKSKASWNGSMTLLGKKADKVLKDGNGSNSDLNFILIAMLNDAGIKAYPAVTQQPNIPKTMNPSIYFLTTTLVAIENGSGYDFIDIMSDTAGINNISPALKGQQVRVVRKGKDNQWENLD